MKKGNGRVEEYNCNGQIEFEGEYLNGKRNGIEKEYYPDGKLLYYCEYLYGKKMEKGWNLIILVN